jgi:endonuclease III related protein
MDAKKILSDKYSSMLKEFSPQGWWPLLELHDTKLGIKPTKTGSVNGYHPKDYSYPKNDSQRFEICLGAILAQNTSWPSVEKALLNLKSEKILDAKKLLSADEKMILEAIKPAGYYNQKCRKIRIFAKFYISLKGRTPSRDELLELWGIGPETADSLLLYAYKKPQFVVYTYTKRMLKEIKLIDDSWTYDDIKELFEKNISRDHKMYQEYHALIVEYGKRMKNG